MEQPNLIKISNVLFYGNTVTAIRETLEFELALAKHSIGRYHRIDLAFNPNVEAELRTTCFGCDFQMFTDLTLPVVTWREYYDDYERWINIARTVSELDGSTLVNNLHLISLRD